MWLLKDMRPVYAYKGISNRLFLLGLQPVDIVITLLGFIFIHGIINSLTADLFYLLLAYFLARKLRHRPESYFLSLALFFFSPPVLPVPESPETFLEKKEKNK